ncbi:hypothetical protein MJO28_005694 [Puccinia striiformis f. sp. tritici]|nr:hypothetical protein MJO28_005694 [Puccinia striiformis f. sp. tritici]
MESRRFESGWAQLLNRRHNFGSLVELWYIEDRKELHKSISKLALMLQHPTFTSHAELSHQTRVDAINCSSSDEAKVILMGRSVRREIFLQGYEHAYKESDDIMKPVLKTLGKFASNWSAQYLAPCSAFVAPSMNGKTRLLMELSKHTCVVYVCLRPESSSGHPPRSRYAAEILLDTAPSTEKLLNQFEDLILAILITVAQFFENIGDATNDFKMTEWISTSLPSKKQLSDPPFWDKVKDEMELVKASKAAKNEQFEAVSVRIQEATEFMGTENLRVLLAIDEARELLKSGATSDFSFFRIFRCALKRIPYKSKIFAVFADTTSRVSNFNPPAHEDPSHRIGMTSTDVQEELFPPIYEIPTFDLNVTAPPTTWQQLQSPFRLFAFSLMALPFGASSSLTDSQAIALLGSTVQPQLYGASRLNSKLVSSHGAQCMFIDPSQEILISEYPSQFTFSSAANEYLAFGDERLIRCIKVLTFTRRQGHLGSGDADELVSRIILLRAMQETMKKKTPPPGLNNVTMPFGHSVRLHDFLETLTGLEGLAKLNLGTIGENQKKRLLDEGQVFWNHFISIDHTPSSSDLLRKLYRGLAINCKPNQPGFDQIFTVYLQSKPTETLDEENITFCDIQVKNRKQNDELEGYSEKWTPEFAEMKLKAQNPYLVLYFSLRDSIMKPNPPSLQPPRRNPPRAARATPQPFKLEQQIVTIPQGELSNEESERRASLAFYGLNSFPFLTPDIVKALEELVDTYPNIESLHKKPSDGSKKYLKRVSPEVSSSEPSSIPKVPESIPKKKRKVR